MRDLESEIEELLVVLGELYGKEMSVAFLGVYKRALLSRLTPERAVVALKQVFASKTYGFPKPYDVIELALGDDETRALRAWERLNEAVQRFGPYKSVEFSDPKIARVVEALGGWLEVNNWETSQMQYRRQEFMRLYKACPDGAETKCLPGILEISNTATGHFEAIGEALRIGDDCRMLVGQGAN